MILQDFGLMASGAASATGSFNSPFSIYLVIPVLLLFAVFFLNPEALIGKFLRSRAGSSSEGEGKSALGLGALHYMIAGFTVPWFFSAIIFGVVIKSLSIFGSQADDGAKLFLSIIVMLASLAGIWVGCLISVKIFNLTDTDKKYLVINWATLIMVAVSAVSLYFKSRGSSSTSSLDPSLVDYLIRASIFYVLSKKYFYKT